MPRPPVVESFRPRRYRRAPAREDDGRNGEANMGNGIQEASLRQVRPRNLTRGGTIGLGA